MPASYDRSAFIDCRLHVLAGPDSSFGDYRFASAGFRTALAAYHRGLEAALERCFGAVLDMAGAADFTSRVFLMLFTSTAHSYLAVRTPWSGYLEAGLLIRRLEETGSAGERVLAASGRIEEAVKVSREAHLEMLDVLAGHVLGARADAVFTSADLLVHGFDDSVRPDPADYPEGDDV